MPQEAATGAVTTFLPSPMSSSHETLQKAPVSLAVYAVNAGSGNCLGTSANFGRRLGRCYRGSRGRSISLSCGN